MSNRNLHNFIKGKLNVIADADTDNTFKFGAEHLYTYANGSLSWEKVIQETLELQEVKTIPFTILAYDGERVPLGSVKVFKHVLPIVFSLRYEYLELWESYIESFSDLLNGKTFDVGGVNTAFSVSNVSPTSVEKELDAEDWIDVTLTVYGYQGDLMLGNDIHIGINELTAGSFIIGVQYKITSLGTTDFTTIGSADNNNGTVFTATGVGTGTGKAITIVEPLSYRTTMSTENSYTTPANLDYGISKTHKKNHNRNVVFLQSLSIDTWIKEIEGDTLNTQYKFIVYYPFTPEYQTSRTMILNSGVASIQNGTSVLLELTFVDG